MAMVNSEDSCGVDGKGGTIEAKLEQILQREELIISLLRLNGKESTRLFNDSCHASNGGNCPGEQGVVDSLDPATLPEILGCGSCGTEGTAFERKKWSIRRNSMSRLGESSEASLQKVLRPVEMMRQAEFSESTRNLFSARAQRQTSFTVTESPLAGVEAAGVEVSNERVNANKSSLRTPLDCVGTSEETSRAVMALATAQAESPQWASRGFFAARLQMSPMAASAAATATRPSPLLAPPSSSSQAEPLSPILSGRQSRISHGWRGWGGEREAQRLDLFSEQDVHFKAATTTPPPSTLLQQQKPVKSVAEFAAETGTQMQQHLARVSRYVSVNNTISPKSPSIRIAAAIQCSLSSVSDLYPNMTRGSVVAQPTTVRAAQVVVGANVPAGLLSAAEIEVVASTAAVCGTGPAVWVQVSNICKERVV